MWEFNPEGPSAIQHFLGIMLEEMYKSFFRHQIECPDTIEDVDLSCNRPAAQVSNPMPNLLSFYLSWYHYKEPPFDQDLITKAMMIRCSAPLPKGLDNPVLYKMLESVPYPVSSKEDDGGNKEGESGPHSLLIPAGE